MEVSVSQMMETFGLSWVLEKSEQEMSDEVEEVTEKKKSVEP